MRLFLLLLWINKTKLTVILQDKIKQIKENKNMNTSCQINHIVHTQQLAKLQSWTHKLGKPWLPVAHDCDNIVTGSKI